MQAEFREDTKKHYFVLTSPKSVTDSKDYRLAMIKENHISGFASCKTEQMNGADLLYYDITEKMCLDEYLNTYKADAEFFKQLFSNLAKALESIREFLLDRDGILLNPKFMFIDAENKRPYFVFYPYNENCFEIGCRSLSSDLLKHIKQEDIEAVKLGYEFYKNCMIGKITVNLLREMAGENGFDSYFMRNRIKNKNVNADDDHAENMTPGCGITDTAIADTAAKDRESAKNSITYDFLFKDDKKTDKHDKKGFFSRIFKVKEKTVEYKAYGKQEKVTTENRDARAWLMPEKDLSRGGVMLVDDSYIVGKKIAGAHISLDSDAVSRIHAKLIWKGSGYCLVDLSSKNGTSVNGKRLVAGEKKMLKSGDRIVFADMKCVYKKPS